MGRLRGRVRRALWRARARLRGRGWLPPAVPPSGARVTTYNIGRGARGAKGARSTTLDQVAATIAAERPDVVALQEVHEPDVPVIVAALAAEHGLVYEHAFATALTAEAMDAVIERARRRPDVDEAFWADRRSAFGLAVLSRAPIASVGVAELPGRGERRVALSARTEIGGHPVTVVSTHLATARRSTEQADQTRALATLVASVEGPVVVAGDLNQEAAAVAAVLAGTGTRLRPATDPDVPTLGWRTIDHVLVTPDIDVRGTKVGDEGVSDHRPVTVALGL